MCLDIRKYIIGQYKELNIPLYAEFGDEGESCGYNFESNWSKKCKLGLRCDSQPNSDGESGTCVKKEGMCS